MDDKHPNELSDDAIQELVGELSADVKQRQTEVDGLQNALEKLRVNIHDQQLVRQKFTEQLFKAEQAVPLIESNKQLREELKEKQTLLRELNEGEAKEQKVVLELKNRLIELQNEVELSQLNKEHECGSAALRDLESSYEQALTAYQSTKEELDKVEREVTELRRKQEFSSSKDKETTVLSLDQQVDKMLKKYCKKAGLKLTE